MAGPSFLKPPVPPHGTVAVPPGFDVSFIDVFRALTAHFERWDQPYLAAQAAWEAATPGPGKDAANPILISFLHALWDFRPDEELQILVDQFYAALNQ